MFNIYDEQIISEADFKEGLYLIRNVKVKVDDSDLIYLSSNKNTKIQQIIDPSSDTLEDILEKTLNFDDESD